MYPKEPESTNLYPYVPECTQWYQKVPDQVLMRTEELKGRGRIGGRCVGLSISNLPVSQSVSDSLRIQRFGVKKWLTRHKSWPPHTVLIFLLLHIACKPRHTCLFLSVNMNLLVSALKGGAMTLAPLLARAMVNFCETN